MSLFRRLTIRTKLVSSFSVLTLLLALIAGYGYYEMGAIGGEVQHVIQGPIASAMLFRGLEHSLESLTSRVREYVLNGDEESRELADQDKQAIQSAIEELKASAASPDEEALIDEIESGFTIVVEILTGLWTPGRTATSPSASTS